MRKTPDGWDMVSLGDCAQVVRGVTYQKSDSRHGPEDGYIPLLRATNVGVKLDLHSQMVYVPRTGVKADQLMRVGDIVLVGSSGSAAVVGKSARLDVPWTGTFGAFCTVLRPRDHVSAKYLSLFVSSPAVRDRWSEAARGTNINNLKRGDLMNTLMPLPPIEEQRRIVDILEDHLSRLDVADGLLTRVHALAKSQRQATFRATLADAGGIEARLDSLAISIRNGIFVSRPKASPKGVPILRIGAVRPQTLDVGDLRYSERSEADLRARDELLHAGDVLFTRYNGNPRFVGACAVVAKEHLPLTYPDKLIRVVVDRTQVHPDFLVLACSVGQGREQIQSFVKTTSGQAGISGRDLRSVQIQIPSLERQEDAIRNAKAAVGDLDLMTKSVTNSALRATSLRRSLLAAAFSGELTA